MPKLSDPSAAQPIRMILLGDSGSGKTGALASLAKAGYNLYIADYDNGIDIVRNLLKDDKAAASRIDFETFRDPSGLQGTVVVPKDSRSWAAGIRYLESAFKSAGPSDIVVIDSLSFAAKAAMVYTLKLNNRLAQRPYESDWGDAQRQVERLVDMITGGSATCHVICTAHIAYQGNEAAGEPIKGYPSMIGKALNQVIGRYFNHTLLCRQVGQGNAVQRKIHTNTFANIELKNSSPGTIKQDYPLATGLAEYFRDAGALPASAGQPKKVA